MAAATAAEQPNIVLIFVDDLDETRDLSAEKPDIVEHLHRAWTKWSEPLLPDVSESGKKRQKGNIRRE